MKRVLAFLLAMMMMMSLGACSSTDKTDGDDCAGKDKTEQSSDVDTDQDKDKADADKTNEPDDDTVKEEEPVEVNVTIEKIFFQDMTEADIKKAAEEMDIHECIVNEDGSVTYSMEESKYDEMMKELKAKFDEMIEGMTEGADAVSSFESIDYADDFSQFDIYVNSEYTSWDSLYAVSFYYTGAYYQSFAGVQADEIDVTVNFIDEREEEVLLTATYKDYMENMKNEDGSNGAAIGVATSLTVGETVNIADTCEISLDYANITDDVEPPFPGSWYSHYEAADGKTFIDVCVAYKNLSATDVDADEIISGSVLYAGKYQYKGFPIVEEDNRSDLTYANITAIAPLSVEYVHYLFEVPEVVGASDSSLRVNLSIAGNQYDILLREGPDGEGDTLSADAIAKTSGSVNLGEVVAIKDSCEFQVDYTDIANDIVPPQPGDWYSHYEADEGKVYVDFCISYKNWKVKPVEADEVMSATLTYADKYEYNGFVMIEEDGRSDFTYANITDIAPLSTEYLHYLFEVPTEVETSEEAIEITFTMGEYTYSHTVR